MIYQKPTYEYFGINASKMKNIERKGIKMKPLKKTFETLGTFRKQKTYLYKTYGGKVDEHILDIIWEGYTTAELKRIERKEYYEYIKKRRAK
jgi:hypothetical protein